MNPEEQVRAIRESAEEVTRRSEQLFAMSFVRAISRINEQSRTPVELENRLVEATMGLLNSHRGVALAGHLMQNATLATPPDPVTSKSLRKYLQYLRTDISNGPLQKPSKDSFEIINAIEQWMKLPPNYREEDY